jgi:alkylation response protein AidB-like acyl-CoA dehydrogenase
MRVIVCGSRTWSDRKRITDRLFDLGLETENLGCTIVVGYNPEKDTPKGVDRLAYQEAQKIGLLTETHPAKWEEFGKAAGFIRNEEMAAAGAALCIAFWDQKSNGTKDMMERARKHGITVEVILK